MTGLVIAFSGHRVDNAGRIQPRFPPSAEASVAANLGEVLDDLSSSIIRGFGALASGGDILFHEACLQRKIPTTILLPLPLEQFLAQSVTPSGEGWTGRAFHLLDVISHRLIDGAEVTQGTSPFERGNHWILQQAIRFAETVDASPVVLVVWDGKDSGEPGGTGHMVQLANSRDVPVIVVDPAERRP